MVSFFFLDTGKRVPHLPDPIKELEARRLQGRTAVIGEGCSNRETIPSDRLIFGGALQISGPLNGSDASQVLLEFCFGMPVSFIEGLGSILQVMKLAQLMRRICKDKGDRLANSLFSIRNHAFDWDRKLFEQVLDRSRARR